jgi:hypothetical protein
MSDFPTDKLNRAYCLRSDYIIRDVLYLHILFQIDHSGFESQKAFQPKLLIVLFYILFLCKCVLYYYHQVSAQLQLRNIWKYQINLCEFLIATLTWFYNVISRILDLVNDLRVMNDILVHTDSFMITVQMITIKVHIW